MDNKKSYYYYVNFDVTELKLSLSVLLHAREIEGSSTAVDIAVQLGQLPHVPLQVLPLVPVEPPANLNFYLYIFVLPC